MVYLAGAAYCDASALRSWSCGQACNGPLSVVSFCALSAAPRGSHSQTSLHPRHTLSPPPDPEVRSQVPGTITVVQNSSMDLQAYVGQLSDGRAIVSFRGTQPSKLADWIDDLKVRAARAGV